MPQTPRWTEFPKYPVIVGVGLLATAVTLAWWAGADISPLFASGYIRRGQFWRLFTTIFPHLNILHLAFNLYWLWIFGTVVERIFGHTKTALLIALFAVGSTSLDFALDRGSVGLSGAGYGLFGLLWVLSARDGRFRSAIDQRTIKLFVGWFFLCIITTISGAYPVANVAHAVGAILGILIGYVLTLPSHRLQISAAIVSIFLFGIWGDTLGRPIVNLSTKNGYEEGQWGYDALIAGHNSEAVKWLRDGVKFRPKEPTYWYNLGVAYQRIGNVPAATAAYRQAHQLDPNNSDYAKASEEINSK
jgi:membrane associated rhomboid family serine protease